MKNCRLPIANCLLAVACVFAAAALAQQPTEGESATAPAVASGPAVTTTTATAPAVDDAYGLLAEAERQRGPTFPGKDPAFLVLPRPAERTDMSDLLTDEVRSMTDKALAYLARAQNADGSFSDKDYSANTGVTALACLAFMAEGSRPRMGKYGKPIDRGLEFLLKNVEDSGIIAGKGSNPYGPMYEHVFSMLALLQAYGDMPWRPRTREVIGKGVQAILRSQKLDGGWRYLASSEGRSDLSVTANVLWVLRLARKSGFSVPAKAVARGVKFVEDCAMPDGTFRYVASGLHASPSLGGCGIIALCNSGSLDHALIAPARDRLAYEYRRYTIDDLKGRRYFAYGCFYASVATYMCGDSYFRPWFRKASQVLAAVQRKDGEIPDEAGNTVYTTAMAAMVLQAPYGYLPVYER